MARATDVEVTGLQGLAYGRVRFSGSIQHGAGRREITMTIEAEDVVHLANALQGCPHNYEDVRGNKPRTLEQARQGKFALTNCGHAVWHLEHPDRPMPCRPDDEKLIDIEQPLALTDR